MKNELAQVLNDFISLAKTHYDRKGNEYLLEQLEGLYLCNAIYTADLVKPFLTHQLLLLDVV